MTKIWKKHEQFGAFEKQTVDLYHILSFPTSGYAQIKL